jgi:hypothetical protein
MSSVTVTKKPYKTVVVTDTKTDTVEVHDPGVAGPPNTLSIGTVTTGSMANATITGVAPTQTLNLVLPMAGQYVHNQLVSASTWTITHNLGYYPAVTVVDSGNNTVIGNVTYISENQLSVSFNATFGGKAYLS